MKLLTITALMLFAIIEMAAQDKANAISGGDNQEQVLKGDSLRLMSATLMASGDFDKGIEACKQAIEIYQTTLSKNDVRYTNACDILCLLYFFKQEFNTAANLLKDVLEIKENTLGKEHVEYLNTLGMIKTCYYQMGEYAEAIQYGLRELEIRKVTTDINSAEYTMSLDLLATCYYNMHDYAEAISLLKESIAIKEKVSGKENLDYLNCLSLLINLYSEQGKTAEAMEYAIEEVEIKGKLYGKNSPIYVASLDGLAVRYYNARNYNEAIRVLKETLAIKNELSGEDNSYLLSLSFLTGIYSDTGQYAEALEYGLQMIEVQRNVNGGESQEYAEALANVGLYYFALANYDKSIELWVQALGIFEKVVGKEHQYYAMVLCNLGNAYIKKGSYAEALQTGTQAIDILNQISGTNDKAYAKALELVALSNFELGHVVEAIELDSRALNIQEKVSGTVNIDYARLLRLLSIYQASLHNYNEAIRLGKQAIDIFEKIEGGKSHPDYAGTLMSLAWLYPEVGDYVSAIKTGEEALSIEKNTLGERHPDYATSLDLLASIYSDIGDYTKALQLTEEALSIRKKALGDTHPEYATSLENMSHIYSNLRDYNKALRLEEEALNIRKSILGSNHYLYAASCHLMALYLFEVDNYEEALVMEKQSIEARTKSQGNMSTAFIPSLSLITSICCIVGNYDRATELGTQVLEVTKESGIDTGHPEYISSLMLQCLTAYSSDNSNLLNQYVKEVNASLTKLVKNSFPNLTTMQRTQFWSKYSNWYEILLHKYAYSFPYDTLSSCGYNGIILDKGLLLNSEIGFTQLIKESGDETAQQMYESLRGMKSQENKLWEEYYEADSIKRSYLRPIIDSLSVEANQMEIELVSKSKEYDNYINDLVVEWQQVRENLNDKDIAVEFVSFPLNADSTMYIAYTLKKDWECPKMIPLFEEKELKAVGSDNYYTSDKVANLVWKPLAEVLEGVEKVYFSPSGELYNIAIESVPSWEDGGKSLVSDKRNFFRLSSTRELALIKDESRWDEAAVYGGLQYDMSVRSMMDDDKQYPKQRSGADLSFYVTSDDDASRDDRDVYQGLPYLKGTKVEAMAVKKRMDADNVPVQLFTDSIGTEASFKALSGKKTSIIHIGTHGFFNKKMKEYDEKELLSFGLGNQKKVIEDAALTNSGLYFAGADNALMDKDAIPDSIDDGKLTALEIAQLDLRGLDLVVLSACQTGLGEITGDGVFGLQRGFKKAGAQTIVMSLWKVDDDATTEFMTRFFQNIEIDSKGHPTNKQQAFRDAQKHLRTMDGGKYDDPKYWAAFVMLDGIN